ncbi:MAG: hypothetical protein NTX52_01840 [Planctomycetota bacterium]|nr:hypothetical protein [Planctomycetota bacterium]
MGEISTTKVLSISECGHDEYWLRDMIYDDPSVLGLGDLQAVMKEKMQSQGGRLDLLLKDPADDSMYEVELQLGATDESHIIRTIEYWDNEKRRWPNRSHTAVLIAEEITSRFYNVVHLLSLAVPVIGIQVNIVEAGALKALHFTKVIDSYEESEEEETPQRTYNEKHWVDKYPGALECACWYRDLLAQYYGEIPTKYFESYISLTVGGIARVWVNKRKNDRALIEVKYVEQNMGEVVDHLNQEGVAFGTRGNKYLTFNVNIQQLKDKQTVHDWVIRRLAPQHLVKPKS